MGNEQSKKQSAGFATHPQIVPEKPETQGNLNWHIIFIEEYTKKHAAAIHELQKSMQLMVPGRKPEFPIDQPLDFDEPSLIRWGQLVVLDIIEEGTGSLAFSRKAMEVWPETILDLYGNPDWVNNGIGELTDQILNIVGRILERLGELKGERRFEGLQLNDKISEVVCGSWVFKVIHIKKSVFRGFITNLVCVREVLYSSRVVMRDLELREIAACLTKEGGVWL